jgi:hypothetical protein
LAATIKQLSKHYLEPAAAPRCIIVSERDRATIGSLAITIAEIPSSSINDRWVVVVASKTITRRPATINVTNISFIARVRDHAAVIGVDGCVQVTAARTASRIA